MLFRSGRNSDQTPPSAGKIGDYLGKNAHRKSIPRHRGLSRLVAEHYRGKSDTPDSSPRSSGSSSAVITTPVVCSTLKTPTSSILMLPLIRQSSAPHKYRQQVVPGSDTLPIIIFTPPGIKRRLEVALKRSGKPVDTPNKRHHTPDVIYRTLNTVTLGGGMKEEIGEEIP